MRQEVNTGSHGKKKKKKGDSRAAHKTKFQDLVTKTLSRKFKGKAC